MEKKTILVTGAGNGIGKALSLELLKMGAKVIAVSRSEKHLQDLRKESKSHVEQLVTIQLDLKDWQTVQGVLKKEILDGQLDGLVNNAGVAAIKSFTELTEADFDETFNVNIKAVFNVTQCLITKLKPASSIVMVSSLASTRSFLGHTIYSSTKAALDSLTRSLSLELADRKIRVNSVNPTVVLTKMGQENWSNPEKAKPLLERIPLERFCLVQEVVDAIVFLLGPKSSFINGHHLLLEGGYSAS